MSPFCREYFYVWTRILESWAKLFTFLREFFYSGGLYKNIGHHSWPTTRNLKKKKTKKKNTDKNALKQSSKKWNLDQNMNDPKSHI